MSLVRLEGHENETDGETDTDQDEQHKQTHVDAALKPLKSSTPLLSFVHRSLRSHRSSTDRLITGHGRSELGVMSRRRTNVRPWVRPWEWQRVRRWRCRTASVVVGGGVSSVDVRLVMDVRMMSHQWLVDVVDRWCRGNSDRQSGTPQRRALQRRRAVAVHLTDLLRVTILIRTLRWRHHVAPAAATAATSASGLRVTWQQAEPDAAWRHRDDDERQRIEHCTRTQDFYILLISERIKSWNYRCTWKACLLHFICGTTTRLPIHVPHKAVDVIVPPSSEQ